MPEAATLGSLPSVFSPLAKALLDGFSEGVVVFDAEGKVLYANQQAREALVGMELTDAAPDLQPRLAAMGGRLRPLRVGALELGEAAGVGDGGILQQSLRALEIRSLPHERPETIEVDVSELNIGDSIAVADLNVPEGVEVLNHPEETVISIVRPAEEEEEEEKAAPAEPELVDEKASEEQESDAE